MSITTNVKAAAIVPGLPHLLAQDLPEQHAALATAMRELGDHMVAAGVERILYYSTQWLSVLGQSFQARSELKGLHVDENWHAGPDLPFNMQVDRPFAERMHGAIQSGGWQSRLVDYNGFPVDTGTIVADQLVNRGRFKTGMMASCVYSDYAETEKLAKTLAAVIAEDGVPTGVVGVSSLSGRYFTTDIDLFEDHIRSPEDDQWNRRILDLMVGGAYEKVESLLPEYNAACKVDMGFKAFGFVKSVAGLANEPATEMAYGPIYGTGAAVLRFV